MQPAINFAERRKKLFAQMKANSVAILTTAPVVRRSADQDYPFSPDNDFYYFTGFDEPYATAVLIKENNGDQQYILFSQSKDPDKEQWNGVIVGQELAVKQFGANKAYSHMLLNEKLAELLIDKEVIYLTLGQYDFFDELMKNVLNKLRSKQRSGIRIPGEFITLDSIVAEMRLFKEESEIFLLRKAAEIAVLAHKQAAVLCRPGRNEQEIHAALVYEFIKNGCQGEAYQSIVAAGVNACTLHYIKNSEILKQNELVLIDAAGRYDYYCADVTRTYPANGVFNAEQKAIYEIVLQAQKAALTHVRPGEPWIAMETAAQKVITEGLIDLGLLQGNADDLLAQEAFKPFYMHRIGHWLGMDTHDVGQYKINKAWRTFEPGMVTTVEPGIYITPGMPVDERWWGIGIRIEDDVLITEKGNEILTAAMPKETAAIEALMAD